MTSEVMDFTREFYCNFTKQKYLPTEFLIVILISTVECSSWLAQRSFPLLRGEMITESKYCSKCAEQANCGVPCPKLICLQYSPHTANVTANVMEEGVQIFSKAEGWGFGCEIVPPRNVKEATPIKSQQYGCYNKT